MLTGRCLCGAIAFEIEGNVSGIWLCHCSKCRRSTGSAFHPAALCRKTRFRWLSGEEEIASYQQSGGYRSTFCRQCGSPVPLVREDEDQVVLSAGTLDGDFEQRLVRHIFVGSKAAWWPITDDLPQFEEHVPS